MRSFQLLIYTYSSPRCQQCPPMTGMSTKQERLAPDNVMHKGGDERKNHSSSVDGDFLLQNQLCTISGILHHHIHGSLVKHQTSIFSITPIVASPSDRYALLTARDAEGLASDGQSLRYLQRSQYEEPGLWNAHRTSQLTWAGAGLAVVCAIIRVLGVCVLVLALLVVMSALKSQDRPQRAKTSKDSKDVSALMTLLRRWSAACSNRCAVPCASLSAARVM